MVDVPLNLVLRHYPTCPTDRRCLASSEWAAVDCFRVCRFRSPSVQSPKVLNRWLYSFLVQMQ